MYSKLVTDLIADGDLNQLYYCMVAIQSLIDFPSRKDNFALTPKRENPPGGMMINAMDWWY